MTSVRALRSNSLAWNSSPPADQISRRRLQQSTPVRLAGSVRVCTSPPTKIREWDALCCRDEDRDRCGFGSARRAEAEHSTSKQTAGSFQSKRTISASRAGAIRARRGLGSGDDRGVVLCASSTPVLAASTAKRNIPQRPRVGGRPAAPRGARVGLHPIDAVYFGPWGSQEVREANGSTTANMAGLAVYTIRS